MKNKAVLWLSLLLLLTPLPGFAMRDVNVAYMPNYASLWCVVTGMEMGYFAQEGLEVNLVEFSDGPTIIAAMENGSIDMGYIGPGAHKLCIRGYAKIFCMSHMGNADAVLGFPSRGVRTTDDLRGKRVGYASGTSSESILRLALADAGIEWSEIIPIEMDASALVTAAISGVIDACAVWSPSTAMIENHLGDDVVVLANNETFLGRSASMASWIVTQQYYESNTEIVEAFTRALYRAMDAHKADMEQTFGWVARLLATDEATVRAQQSDGYWLASDELVALIDSGEMKRYYQLQQESFFDLGAIETMASVEDFVLFDNMLNAAATP